MMMMRTIQAEQNPATNSNVGDASELQEIKDARARVASDEEDADKANSWLKRALLAYAVISVLVVLATLWGMTANSRLRRSDDNLALLQSARTEQLRQQNLATEIKLEEERQTRLKIEADLAWRVIDSTAISDTMRAFTGIVASITSIEDPEAMRLARTLETALGKAQWGVAGPDSIMEKGVFPDGVSVVAIRPPAPEKDRRSWDAARSLVKELTKQKLEVNLVIESMEEYRPNIVTIRVGARSMKYLDPLIREGQQR
jgi:hypothetical protein